MSTKTFSGRVSQKRDTAANWSTNNPILLDGEIAIVDTAAGNVRIKIGDGTKAYNQLPFQDEAIYTAISDSVKVYSGVITSGETSTTITVPDITKIIKREIHLTTDGGVTYEEIDCDVTMTKSTNTVKFDLISAIPNGVVRIYIWCKN